MKKTFLNLTFLISALTSGCFASPVTYVINFTSTQDVVFPTAASFTYDDAAAVTARFTKFFVIWDGLTFNLTAQANQPNVAGNQCGTVANATVTFALLNHIPACTPSNGVVFRTLHVGTDALVQFTEEDNAFGYATSAVDIRSSLFNLPPTPPNTGIKDFQFTVTPVPEPSTLWLSGMGIALLWGWSVRRKPFLKWR